MSHDNSQQGALRRPGADDPNRIISQKLKAYYASVQDEGIPDRFLDLLEKLDAAERSAKSGKSGDE
ncbi:NepR family anti-sigma factor [Salaquimonas pukyongi]|uniref:NepR family anti-sigma factor n=1 Tax=Salaquimonas pukyongi TaxID=2712698 RepID=UPI00096B944C|nr:NepR family anti-sigma factor [Salaquimonas pukyongi]